MSRFWCSPGPARKDNGYPVQTARGGCEIKGEEVQLKLHPPGLVNLPVTFFNAAEDAPDELRFFIRSQIEVIRKSWSQI
jgi:hypothetical protein